MKLEYLAPYLPYKLTMAYRDAVSHTKDYEYTLTEKELIDAISTCEHMPILRPLSDIDKPNDLVSNHESPLHFLVDTYYTHSEALTHLKRTCFEDNRWMYCMPLYIYSHLLEWHFDVFDLISRGEAIDINTLKKNSYGKV